MTNTLSRWSSSRSVSCVSRFRSSTNIHAFVVGEICDTKELLSYSGFSYSTHDAISDHFFFKCAVFARTGQVSKNSDIRVNSFVWFLSSVVEFIFLVNNVSLAIAVFALLFQNFGHIFHLFFGLKR